MPIYYTKMKLTLKEKTVFAFAAAAVGTAVGILFYDSMYIAVAVSLLGAVLYMPIYRQKITEKHKSELLIQFRDLLYSLSASISSGRSMREALEEAREFCGATYEKEDYIMRELEYMCRQLRNGNAVDTDVLGDFARRSGLGDIEDFVSVYESCKGSGGNLKKAISRATSLIGDKIELERELKSLLAQKLFEGRIVGIAPFAIVLMIRLTAAEYMEAMTESAQGRIITTLAVVLIAVAVGMTERIHSIEI